MYGLKEQNSFDTVYIYSLVAFVFIFFNIYFMCTNIWL